MVEVLLDALLDSLKILGIVFAVNLLIAFFESKITNSLEKSKKWSPLAGATLALIPECGFSVVSTDLYKKRHITAGTLIAIYIATSDEAIPIILSYPNKYLELLILIGIKLLIGVIIGYIVDLLLFKAKINVHDHIESEECHHHEESHVGCCKHEIEDTNKLHRYLIHPLKHSLKIFLFVLIINIAFGTMIYFIGEDNISDFITSNTYLTPLFTVLVGLVPNCASSLLISKLYVLDAIGFGALIGGLIVNAGLGPMILLKDKENLKSNLTLFGILIAVGLIVGYTITIIGF